MDEDWQIVEKKEIKLNYLTKKNIIKLFKNTYNISIYLFKKFGYNIDWRISFLIFLMRHRKFIYYYYIWLYLLFYGK